MSDRTLSVTRNVRMGRRRRLARDTVTAPLQQQQQQRQRPAGRAGSLLRTVVQ